MADFLKAFGAFGNTDLLLSTYPFVPAAQQLIIRSSGDNRSAAIWADHRWNVEWLENTTRLRTFIPDPASTLPEWLCQEERGSGMTVSA